VRVVAGSRKGHRLSAPRGVVTRPTGDRVREAAFSLIGPVEGARVLDLFAGSGAMGIEALSRGAARCVFVESDRAACAVISRNLEKLRLTSAIVLCQDVQATLREERGRRHRFDLVLADAPYQEWERYEGTLAELLPDVLEPHGLVVIETSARVEPSLPLAPVTSRRYGSARLTLFRRE
jgi:16S rRNA (guanine966-N2)-methyltransferase